MSRKHRMKDREGLPPLWDEKSPGRVSQDFLDLLNQESARMSDALQNPANWAGIMGAAQGQISALQQMLGLGQLGHPFGTIGGGAISQREYEDLFAGRPAPATSPAEAEAIVVEDYHPVGPVDGERSTEEQALIEHIRAEVNGPPRVSIEYPETLRRRFVRMGKRLIESMRII